MIFSFMRGSSSRRWLYLISPFVSLVFLRYLLWPTTDARIAENLTDKPYSTAIPLDCPHLPGLKDVQVVLKTGVTEALEKVPVHLNTTLRCIPHFVLFSDFEEDIAGVHVHDVLRNVDETVKSNNPDFELYNRLLRSGRDALTPSDYGHDSSTPFGKPDNPGWRLDKWKFLPMIDETLKIRNDAKWYVFIEADTYTVWPNLMAWLEKFNAKKPHYLGNQMQIGDVIFAHGGSGFVLSRAAMKKVSDLRFEDVKQWDDYTDVQWAGDCVLGRALSESGVNLFWAWPMVQGATPWEFDYFNEGYQKQPWCIPPVAYHHLTPDHIRELWEFEENWHRTHPDSTMLHGDVFKNIVQTKTLMTLNDWDNLSIDESGKPAGNLAECEAHCNSIPECVQYSLEGDRCLTLTVAKFGGAKAGVTSGWISHRVEAATQKKGICEEPQWVT